MPFIFLTIGFALGCTITLLINSRCKIHGFVEVDHNTRECKFHLSSGELSDRKSKKIVFEVRHDVEVSREEQGL